MIQAVEQAAEMPPAKYGQGKEVQERDGEKAKGKKNGEGGKKVLEGPIKEESQKKRKKTFEKAGSKE